MRYYMMSTQSRHGALYMMSTQFRHGVIYKDELLYVELTFCFVDS